jgi:large subunit ribosomal protein L18
MGTSERPRLSVYKSLKHIYAQIIDDQKGTTLVAASTVEQGLRDRVSGANAEAAKQVGVLIAQKAVAQGINTVVFDRSGYKYHGCIMALADAARENGLNF